MTMKTEVNINDLTPKEESIALDIINIPASKTKYHVVRASRQSGKTFLNERLALYFALTHKGCIIAYINALHKQNDKVYESMLKWIPEQLIARAVKGDNRSITFVNGSMIQFYTASSHNAVVGATFDYMFADEFALWRQSSWTYIQPVVAAKKNAKIIISSTPRGRNQFYDVCMKGQSDDPFYKEYRMLYSDNPYYDVREVEDAKNSSTDFAWRQEYMGEFIFGESKVFGSLMQYQKVNKWAQPDPGRRFFMGLDIAGDGEDATVIAIVDDEGKVAYIEEINDLTFPAQVRKLVPIINKYQAEGYGETNGLGGPVVDMLQERNLHVHDFITSNKSKQQLVTNFIRLMHKDEIQLPTVELCAKLDNEMSLYEASRTAGGALTYHHPKGLHDDYVDALLMAYQARNVWLFGGQEFRGPDDYEEEGPVPIEDYDKLSFRELRDLEAGEDYY